MSGVVGFRRFVSLNDGFCNGDGLLDSLELKDSRLIVDVNSLSWILLESSQQLGRSDILGGDLVAYGQFARKFFERFVRCNVQIILVFKGEQNLASERDEDAAVSKYNSNTRVFSESFEIYERGDEMIAPAATTMIIRSIALDMGVKIVQLPLTIYQHAAHLSLKLECPILTSDGFFYLDDLPHGFIPFDSLGRMEEEGFIACKLYRRDHFLRLYPRMDLRNLILLGALTRLSKDENQLRVIREIQSKLTFTHCLAGCARMKRISAVTRSDRLLADILSHLCCKSHDEAIEYIVRLAGQHDQQIAREILQMRLPFFQPKRVDEELGDSLRTILKCPKGRQAKVADWLAQLYEKTVIPRSIVKMLSGNIVTIHYSMNDPNLNSSRSLQLRQIRVARRLIRSSEDDLAPARVLMWVCEPTGGQPKVINAEQIAELEKFGRLDHLIHDLPALTEAERRAILLATFHCSVDEFDKQLALHQVDPEDQSLQEFFTLKLLLYAVDVETPNLKLSSDFKQAALSTFVYYLGARKNSNSQNYRASLVKAVDQYGYVARTPMRELSAYNRRTMHQIGQLQLAIGAYNNLNALLADPTPRLRPENWLNSCLLYNLAEDPEIMSDKIPAELSEPFELPNATL